MTLKGDDLYIYTDKQKDQAIYLSFESGLIHNPEAVEQQEKEVKVNKKSDNKKAKSKKDDKWENEQKKKTIKESNKYDYTIECFPIHYIKKGDVIYVESDDVSGFMQVEEVSISLSDSWNMKLGVKVMKDDGKHKDNSSKNTKNKKG